MSGTKILIIDDELKLRSLMTRVIGLEGYDVSEASDARSAKKMLEKEEFAVVICDVKLPDANGIEFTMWIRRHYPGVEVIVNTAFGNIKDGVSAIKNGAFDYLTKGDDNDRLLPLISRAAEKSALQYRVQKLESSLSKKYGWDSILGNSSAISEAKTLARKVAPTDTNVLLLGETGTGKEVFAQALHYSGARQHRPFLELNCSAFSKTLLESELFGYKAGAFTGAVKDKKGILHEANGGTLFLDEIGELDIELQAKFLRVLESGEFFRVGDTVATRVDVRIIAATNRDLQKEIENNRFREDLYYRLSTFIITLPPLRERKNDIPVLAQHFMELSAVKVNRRCLKLSEETLKMLKNYSWKGNIRELKNVIERAVILSDGDTIEVSSLPADIRIASGNSPDTSPWSLEEMEKQHIRKVLLYARGNKTEAARLLNIGLTTLYRKIEEYRIIG
jgi:DNA-binding NtrC family response regulator